MSGVLKGGCAGKGMIYHPELFMTRFCSAIKCLSYASTGVCLEKRVQADRPPPFPRPVVW